MNNLEKYFTTYCIKTVNNKTLEEKLPDLPIKTCPICDTMLKYRTSTGLTKQYCSNKCAYIGNKDKIKETNLKKYGVEYNIISKNNKEKTIKTNIEKYGVNNPLKNKEIREKIKQTNIKKYGVDNPVKSEVIKNKIIKTNIEKYGFNSPSQNENIRNKIKETNIKRYGNNSGLLHSEKTKETRIKNIIKKNHYFNGDFTFETDPYSYIYKCNDCGNISKYIIKEERDFLLQRFRFKINPCNKCLPRENIGRNQRSNLELFLEKDLKDLGIKTEHKKDIDIYLPDYNIGIEINGDFWHSDKFKTKYQHRDKILKFRNKGIQLLCFSEYEINNKKETIINYIKGKLGLLQSIGASKCKLKEIKAKEARIFCDKYHIHGYSIGSKNYGLFLKDKLVSVCIIGRNRFSKTDDIEIIRLCNSNKIIGGFARFLKLIKKDFPNKDIITFINAYLGLSEDNIFTKNGFKYIGLTEPNYNWISKNKIISRYKTQQKNEDSIMKGLGFNKVYDAGNYKFGLFK